VSSLFTNVPVDERIEILVEKAVHKEWLNYKCNLALKESDLRALLNIAVKNQLLQLDGKLYEQTDGVAMGSPQERSHTKYLHVLHRGETCQQHGHAIFLPSFC
jgi:hypothetical protein